MKFCKTCLQPDTRPNIQFNHEGICPPCQYMEKFNQIDWTERENDLKEIINFGKENNVSGYDCIIGVSGGKDSTRQAMFVKEQLSLNPLLVCCSYPPEQLTDTGADNISNLISLGFDTISISPAPLTWKKLMLAGFLQHGNWAKSTEMALYASLPRLAIAYHIPLIFLGENPAIQDGELGSGSLNWDGTGMRNYNTIKDGPEELLKGITGISEQDIISYRYPSEDEMSWGKLKIVYLGYFWKNFSKPDNGNYSILQGLEIRDDPPSNQGSLYPFECIDEDFVVVNQMIKYMKFGFGKVTEDVCEAIRLGRISREEGAKLVDKFDGKCDKKYISRFCQYLQIDEEKFWDIAESYRNKDIWQKDKNGGWKLKYKPYDLN